MTVNLNNWSCEKQLQYIKLNQRPGNNFVANYKVAEEVISSDLGSLQSDKQKTYLLILHIAKVKITVFKQMSSFQ